MAISYATGGTAPTYGGIGWINYGSLVLGVGTTVTGVTGTLKDGSTITFNLSNQTGATVRAVTGTVAFTDAFAGVTGSVVLYADTNSTNTRLVFSSIVVKDPYGVTIPNYTLYIGDGERTSTGESIRTVTNGGNWFLYTTGGTGSSPTVSGLSTLTVTFQGNAFTYNCPICGTTNATNVTSTLGETAAGRSGVVFGVSINKISLGKNIVNRYDASDQFVLNINGAYSSTTTTYGATYGTQPGIAYVYPSLPGTYILTESIAPGSAYPLSAYSQSIAYTNLSAGGTTVPTSTTLPGTIQLNSLDVIVATITNAIIPPTASLPKSVDPSYAPCNYILTYTIPVKNNGPVTLVNVGFIDTIPTGTTFVSNSLSIDGSIVSGSPEAPGVTLPNLMVGGVSTISFKVQVSSTIPSPNIVLNNASTSFSFYALPNTLTNSSSSNQVVTTINYATIACTKSANPTFVDCGNTIVYTITLKNNGNIIAYNVIFQDSIPIQTQYISDSLTLNGATLPGENPNAGVDVGSILPGNTSTITFAARAVC